MAAPADIVVDGARPALIEIDDTEDDPTVLVDSVAETGLRR